MNIQCSIVISAIVLTYDLMKYCYQLLGTEYLLNSYDQYPERIKNQETIPMVRPEVKPSHS
jgi:hypothetical protein